MVARPQPHDFKELTCRQCVDGAGLDFDFTMALQPIVDVEADTVYAQEALCRGLDGGGAGSVLARIDDSNRFSFDQACRVKAVRLAASLGVSSYLSINFMPDAIYRPEVCIRTTLAAAKTYGFPHDRIIFEVTEDRHVADKAHLDRVFRTYRRLGFKTAIDDFGAGYSGLGLLADFQPDIIKLDMHLIRGLDADRARQAIVRGMTRMCEELGIDVVAEGIETADELRALRDVGIRLCQGYFIARPEFEGVAALSPQYEALLAA